MNEMELVTDVPVIEMELDVVTRNYPVIPNPEGTPTEQLKTEGIGGVIYEIVDEEARTALGNKVDKEEGKGLSEEDFTHTLKAKLDGIEAGAEVNTVNSVAGKTGNVTLDKSDVGLGNVDNTSDMNKPVSTATQTALNGKVDNSTLNNYYTKIQTDSALSLKADSSSVYTKTETDNLLNGKVDKVEGYDLMSNTDKTKLDGIEAEANKTVVDNLVTSTSTNPVESKAIYNLLNDLLPEATATGNPIAISNASGLNAKSLKVELEPIQDTSGGEPSPTNPCPISGRTQTTVSVNSEDTTIQFGQTVYGGEVDVTSGGTDASWAFESFDGSLDEGWALQSINTHNIANFRIDLSTNIKRYQYTSISNRLTVQTSLIADTTTEGYTISNGNILYIRIKSSTASTVEQFRTWLSTNNIEFCGEKATPTTLTTPANEISLLKGNNTLVADGDMELIYSKTPQ